MIKTRLTELLGIDHPIVQGGMKLVGTAELAAAVSNAGGLGLIGSVAFPSGEELRQEIRNARRLTTKPIGVNITLLPSTKPLPNDQFVKVVVEEGVPFVETSGYSPEKFIDELKRGNVKVMHKVGSVKHALVAERLGCDLVAVLGFEGGGHPPMDDLTFLNLIPRVVDEVRIPVVAAGGIADGRQLAAALVMGACGVLMGTRFVATQESNAHPQVKAAFVSAREVDTLVIQRTIGNQTRVIRNKPAEKAAEMERRGTTLEELLTVVRGDLGRVALETGQVDAGVISCGQGVGLVQDLPTVKQLMDRLIDEAVRAIERLAPAMVGR